MKNVSELIKKLQDLQAEHGDIEVCITGVSGEDNFIEDIREVALEYFGNDVKFIGIEI